MHSPRLGARIIPSVSRIVTLAIRLLRQSVTSLSDKGNMGIAISCLLALAALFQTVPTFVAAQLQNILQLCVQPGLREAAAADKTGRLALALNSLTTAATKKVPPKSLFANVTTLWERSDKTSRLQVSGLLDIFVRSLRAVSATTFGDVYKQAFALLVSIFDTRRSAALPAEDAQAIENTAISAYMQMVLKLNEGTFRPLFLRLFDWAVVDLVNDPDGAMHRKITLFRIMDRMLSQLKTIAVPYYSYMLDQVVEILGGNAQQEVQLVDAVMSSLRRAFEHDTIGASDIEKELYISLTRRFRFLDGKQARQVGPTDRGTRTGCRNLGHWKRGFLLYCSHRIRASIGRARDHPARSHQDLLGTDSVRLGEGAVGRVACIADAMGCRHRRFASSSLCREHALPRRDVGGWRTSRASHQRLTRSHE